MNPLYLEKIEYSELIEVVLANNKCIPYPINDDWEQLLSWENFFAIKNFATSYLDCAVDIEPPTLKNDRLEFYTIHKTLCLFYINLKNGKVYVNKFGESEDEVVNDNLILHFYFWVIYFSYYNRAVNIMEDLGENKTSYRMVGELEKELKAHLSMVTNKFEFRELVPFWNRAIDELIPY